MATLLQSASDLESLHSREPRLKLIDVRLPADYETAHLPGALHQCVFEVVFLDGLSAKSLAKDQPLAVYGASTSSHESSVAAGKLERAGFTDVYDFRGGVDEWRKSGKPLEGPGNPAPEAIVADGVHALDLEQSRVEWTGRNLINKHTGQISIKSGSVEIQNGNPVRGTVVLDMHHMTCHDLAGYALHDVLIHHLQSDDFFDVESFPEAAFNFEHAEVRSQTPGCPNLSVDGEFTLHGVTKPLHILATAGLTASGQAALQAAFQIDRTQWGVIYGSGKFFRRLADHLVNDHIEIQLRLITQAKV